jgi:hypothetical protein
MNFETAMKKFFGVALRGQTYLNMAYLLLAFPLGIFYFCFLVTGISLGVSLIIIFVGGMILLGMFAAWYGLAVFERKLAVVMLHENIPAMTREDLSGKSIWDKFAATVKNPVTWKGLLYLLAKFPIGIFSFVVVVTLVSVSVAFLATPVAYAWAGPSIHPQIQLETSTIFLSPALSTALVFLLFVAGVILAVASMHAMNGLAWLSGKFARIMLGNFSAASTALPPQPTPAVSQTPAES